MEKTSKKVRLIHKTSQSYLWITFALALLSTIALYFYVKQLLQKEVEEELFSTKARVVNTIATEGIQPTLSPIIETSPITKIHDAILKDTVIYDPSQNEMEEFRELISFETIKGHQYKIIVRALIVETDNILIAIILSYIVIILLIFIFLFYFNKARNQKIWNPFFLNLEKMKSFSLHSPSQLNLVESDILEFHELNKEISALTNKVKADYLNLKQFTENVSHEIQTPLAVMTAKIENIINDEDISTEQYNHLTSIQKDIHRLTQLNKRITLLTKIENKQFHKTDTLSLTDLMETTLANFNEISPANISYRRVNEIEVSMDSYLADVLCTNLISNAIKYNTDNKDIIVEAKKASITVANYGSAPIKNPENLYLRFYREQKSDKSTGLGLAIVKRICELYGFTITYNFSNQYHTFSVEIS